MGLFIGSVPLFGATVDLVPLLKASTVLDLNPANTYQVSGQYDVTRNTTINGNGAVIQVLAGPLGVKGTGVTLHINSFSISGRGWGVLSASGGGKLVVTGSATISSTIPGSGTCVFVSDSSLDITDATIKQASTGLNATGTTNISLTDVSFSGCTRSFQQQSGSLTWNKGTVNQAKYVAVYVADVPSVSITGVNVTQSTSGTIAFSFAGNSGGALHGVSASGVSSAVQIVSGTVTVDRQSFFSCPYLMRAGAAGGIANTKGGAGYFS